MIDALLFVGGVPLQAITDAIDVYEGSIPPAATFQVIDVDNTTTEEPQIIPGPA
ncbi:hypothetical protein ST201phi2-1p443 [Pseudomonas phage 201phi2-1]|uniref:Uncharacterized protein n=1 Tax=Pseudomonas phage 201phi2-1 TaxID=198110 RepID=B3FJV1_BP201|nr:hypothetical protein ST201phi2-1p443 [Pseudomonas phage 201phi2-1]ABY63266.1 hypothetical protein 201phi2-1p443 [Pseudomonas phage 201phi2-1]